MQARSITGAVALGLTLALGAAVTPADAAGRGTTILAAGRSQLGDRYSQVNPQGPNHWDCSGLVRYAAGKAGVTLPRVAHDQWNATKSKRVAPANRKPGDLVFIISNGYAKHAGIYAGYRSGKGWLVNANTGRYRGLKVVEAPLGEYTPGEKFAAYTRP